jgi:branched-chain amino acid transport system ATP-binding protein
VLEVRGLDAFYGQARALREVDLDVREGEIVCVVGPNGAGKSTLVNAVAGLHRSVRGRIDMNGADLTMVPAHRICQFRVAVVPEGRRIFPAMSVRDNLDLGAYRSGARARHGESLTWVHSLFPILQQRAGQLAGSLSGGEQQMLAIGRALMAQPTLLLMDEPSLGLAPVVVDEVIDVIGTINRAGVAILLVEQNVERALAASSRGYLLIEGRVVATGTTGELRNSAQVRDAVLGL